MENKTAEIVKVNYSFNQLFKKTEKKAGSKKDGLMQYKNWAADLS